MKKFLFYLVEWTWALPINLIGFIAYIIFAVIKGCKHERFFNATVTYVPGDWGRNFIRNVYLYESRPTG